MKMREGLRSSSLRNGFRGGVDEVVKKEDLNVGLCLGVSKNAGVGEEIGVEVKNEGSKVGVRSVECGRDDGTRMVVDGVMKDCVVDIGNGVVGCVGVSRRGVDVGGEGKEGVEKGLRSWSLRNDDDGGGLVVKEVLKKQEDLDVSLSLGVSGSVWGSDKTGVEVKNEGVEVGVQSVEFGCDDGGKMVVDGVMQDCLVDNGNGLNGCVGVSGQKVDVGCRVKEGLGGVLGSVLGVHEVVDEGRSGNDEEKVMCDGEIVDVKAKNIKSFIIVDGGLRAENRLECSKKMGGVELSECKSDEEGVSENLAKDTMQGTAPVVGRILRSRIVHANVIQGKSGCGRKRKKGSDDSREVTVIKDENEKPSVGYGRSCKRRSLRKSSGHMGEEIGQVKEVPLVSKDEEESASNSRKKGGHGRRKKYADCIDEKEVPIFEVNVEFEVDENFGRNSVRTPTRTSKRGRPTKCINYNEQKTDLMCSMFDSEVEDENVRRDSKKKGKRGRPKKLVDHPCKESVRTPKKEWKRGRSKRQESDGVEKDDREMKVSLVTKPIRKNRRDIHPHRAPESPDVGVPSKNVSGRSEKSIANFSSKGEETPLSGSKSSVNKRGKQVVKHGSITAEKNVIRKQIVDMLLGGGWTVEYRRRQSKEYSDAVYVNPQGKTHWSVTKAYFAFKQEVEEAKLDFCFTPIPEEILCKLFKFISKPRSDKRKNDSPDEEFLKDGSKGGRSAAQRELSDSRRRCALRARHSSQGTNSENGKVTGYAGKHSVLAWMIDSGVISSDAKVQCMSNFRTKSVLEGSVTRDGIRCSCCKKVISVLEFENHAGGRLCEPYQNVCLVDRNSLLECLVDSWSKQPKTGRTGYYRVPEDGDDPNDDTCGICGDGGDLVCCDGCPSTFHHDCLDIEEIPADEWLCVYCSCKFCGGGGETASNKDDNCDTTISSLATCSLCDQKYHQSCIDKEDDVCSDSKQPTFCGRNCKQIFEQLQSLVGAKHDIGDEYSWTFLQRSDVEADASTSRAQNILGNSKLAVALSIMDECFLPIIDHRSGIDLIRHIVYSCGSNFNRLNFRNFFTVILERGDEVICAASIRIHGKTLAEMPFIGTRNIYRRQGMCRRLVNAIELTLGLLGIEKLVIPAIPELINTWTSVFGFKPVEESVKAEMRSVNMLVFPYMGMLRKLVKSTIDAAEENIKGCESDKKNTDGEADELKANNGCMSGKFDLNCVAADSSSDERQLIHFRSSTGNCENDVTSGVNSEGMTNGSKVEHGDQEPDMNLMQEVGEVQVHHGPAAVNPDKAVKNPDFSITCTNSDLSNGVNFEGKTDGNPVEIGLTPEENDGHQDEAHALVLHQSDMNLMERYVPGESLDLGVHTDHEIQDHCGSATVNRDKVVKTMEYSCDLITIDG